MLEYSYLFAIQTARIDVFAFNYGRLYISTYFFTSSLIIGQIGLLSLTSAPGFVKPIPLFFALEGRSPLNPPPRVTQVSKCSL